MILLLLSWVLLNSMREGWTCKTFRRQYAKDRARTEAGRASPQNQFAELAGLNASILPDREGLMMRALKVIADALDVKMRAADAG